VNADTPLERRDTDSVMSRPVSSADEGLVENDIFDVKLSEVWEILFKKS